jgi:hypothetical protein
MIIKIFLKFLGKNMVTWEARPWLRTSYQKNGVSNSTDRHERHLAKVLYKDDEGLPEKMWDTDGSGMKVKFIALLLPNISIWLMYPTSLPLGLQCPIC